MKISIFLVLGFAYLASGYITKCDLTRMKDDKDLVLKQKFILEMFRHVHQKLHITEYLMYGKTFVEGEVNYINYVKVKRFFEIYKTKLLPRGEVFSIMNERHLMEVRGLFHLFYFSKDWMTFQKNVIWARIHVNQGMFIYALTAAVIHRDDMVGIMLPSPYEIMPHKFIDSEIMTEGIKYKLQKKMGDDYTYLIMRNDTDLMLDYMMNKEDKLRYFTEDVGLNSWYYFFHMDYPFWLGGKDFGLDVVRRGEKFLYLHQQLLARYYLERLSNGLGEIREIDWTKPIVTGYFPNLRYYNGLIFPMRHNNYLVKTLTKRDKLIVKVMDYERRLRDVIDRGFLIVDDKRIDITDYRSIDILGNLIQGNPDSYDFKFYKYVCVFARLLLGGSFYTGNDYRIVPSVLEHFETTLRDPVFYQLYKRFVRFYFMYKDNLDIYTKDELWFKGVTIDDVKVNKLVTYFDFFDIDITNGIDITKLDKTDYVDMYHKTDYDRKDMLRTTDDIWKYVIKYRTKRLNHDLITLNLDITSDKDTKAVVRVFLGPKYDDLGRIIKLKDNRENFVELDKFVYDLRVGKNIITRTSRDFYYTIPDGTTYRELYKRVMTGMDVTGKMGVGMEDYYCGWPDRLLIPKGKVGGLHMQMFFMITPLVNTKGTTRTTTGDIRKVDKVVCGARNLVVLDDLPLGYPFDRKIDIDTHFMGTNMLFKDIIIFHRKDDMRMNYVI